MEFKNDEQTKEFVIIIPRQTSDELTTASKEVVKELANISDESVKNHQMEKSNEAFPKSNEAESKSNQAEELSNGKSNKVTEKSNEACPKSNQAG